MSFGTCVISAFDIFFLARLPLQSASTTGNLLVYLVLRPAYYWNLANQIYYLMFDDFLHEKWFEVRLYQLKDSVSWKFSIRSDSFKIFIFQTLTFPLCRLHLCLSFSGFKMSVISSQTLHQLSTFISARVNT